MPPAGPPPGWYGPPVAGPPPGYQYPYPGYPGYPYPGYPGGYPPGYAQPAWNPGIIALRPLSLADIFNGAVGYVRANPAATLGLTTVIVMITVGLQLVAEVSQSAAGGDAAGLATVLTAVVAGALATILLSGMLTVVVARSVLGAPISIAEAWRGVRGRLPALVALSLLEVVAVVALIAAAVLVIAGVAAAANGGVAAVVGVPVVILTVVAVAYLFTVLTFAPVAIVLERKSVTESIRRSFALARNRFWRILGIRTLASLIAFIVAGAMSVPFAVLSALVSAGQESAAAAVAAAVIGGVGNAVGQIITAPFTAGVVVLLYVDARIRSEAFDLVLQTAGRGPADDLWLTPP